MRALLSADASSGVQKQPSVHAEGLAGDVAGVVGGAEQHGRCDIQVRVAEAPRRYGGDGRGHRLGIGALDVVGGLPAAPPPMIRKSTLSPTRLFDESNMACSLRDAASDISCSFQSLAPGRVSRSP